MFDNKVEKISDLAGSIWIVADKSTLPGQRAIVGKDDKGRKISHHPAQPMALPNSILYLRKFVERDTYLQTRRESRISRLNLAS